MRNSIEIIDQLISDFFAAFDNRNNRNPDYHQFANCFVAHASIGINSSEGVNIYSLQQFWQPRAELLTQGRLTEFHEWETESKTSVIGSLATRELAYSKEGLLDGSPYQGGGTKCFLLALNQDGWRIVYFLWEEH